MPDPEPEVPPGTLLGAQERYRVVRLLGQGGMGRVYEARRERDEQPAAVKVLRSDRVGGNLEELVARFRQEAAAAGRVGHAGIVEVYGFERTPDGRVLLAMELLQGMTFEDWMSSEGTLAEGLDLVAQFCDALHAAHEAGIVHRDIKPENLFLHRDPATGTVRPTILDFGLAKVDVPDHTQIETAAGTVLGTPYYLAPERALGKLLTPSADLYSLGVVLYELVAGVLPFDGNAFMAILEGHVRRIPLDPRQAAPQRPIPASVSELVMALLSKDPSARPATAAEVALRIRGLLASEGEALQRCSTGPRASAAPDADTMSMLALAQGHTAAPLPDAWAEAATVPPIQSSIQPPILVEPSTPRSGPRRRLGLFVGVGAVVGVGVAAGFVLLQPAAEIPETAEVAPEPDGKAPSAAPVPRPATPAEPAPIESVVAVPKPRPDADEGPADEAPSAKPAGGGTNAAAKKRRPKPETQAPTSEPKPSSLPAFKDDVYAD